jgi:NAD kinase
VGGVYAKMQVQEAPLIIASGSGPVAVSPGGPVLFPNVSSATISEIFGVTHSNFS